MFLKRPLFILLLLASFNLFAQRREDFLSMQRDIAQLQDQVRQMQTAQDEKMAAIQSLVQQALEESHKLNTALADMQKSVGNTLNEQQAKIVVPVASLGTKVDEVSDDLRAVRENLAALGTRISALDTKLTDVSSAVRTLNSAPAIPPPPAAADAPAAPAGVTADSLWTNAFRDYSSGKDELAMNEFADYVKYFPQTENAPSAQYYIGQLYIRAKQYDDAVQAFDAVLERYPENQKTPDALYMKGVAMMNTPNRPDAAAEFREFLDRYPAHSLANNAQTHLRTLAGTRSTSKNKRK